MAIQLAHKYEHIISLENLLEAWKEFLNGKRSRKDVQIFEMDLMGNIIALHQDLFAKTYTHSPYQAFNISDPKPRNIHKAAVRDRLLHHALYRVLYPFFDKTFITDSYSCRLNKGTHKAINRFRQFAYIESKNHTKTTWVLKCDIRKFFGSIDHLVLKEIIKLQGQKGRYAHLFAQEVISFEEHENYSGPVKEKILILENQIAKARLEETPRDELVLPRQDEVEIFAREAREHLENLSFEEKRDIVRRASVKVVSAREELQVHGFISLNQFNVVFRPKYRDRRPAERGEVHAL